jgi:hypothetical protein
MDEVAQSGAQVAGDVDVGRGDVDADDAVASAAGDLPRGPAESRAEVQDTVALGKREATDERPIPPAPPPWTWSRLSSAPSAESSRSGCSLRSRSIVWPTVVSP